MSNPFRQLLQRLIRSSDPADDPSESALDLVADDAFVSESVPASESVTTSDPGDSAVSAITAPSSDDVLKSTAAIAPPEPALPVEIPHAEPQPVDIPQTEWTQLHDALVNASDSVERERHSPSRPTVDKAFGDRKYNPDIYIIEPRSRKRNGIMEEPLGRFDPNPPGLASLIRGEPVADPIPDPVEPRCRCNGNAAGSGRTSNRDQDDSLAARIKQLLDSFEQTGQRHDGLLSLERLEKTFQRFQTSQHDLSLLAERLDHLETAHFMRGRL
jgi:hypothetical protein